MDSNFTLFMDSNCHCFSAKFNLGLVLWHKHYFPSINCKWLKLYSKLCHARYDATNHHPQCRSLKDFSESSTLNCAIPRVSNYIQIKSSSGSIHYLLQDILIACPADQREGEDEHIHTPVAKRPQSAVILLTCIQGQAEPMIRRRKRKKILGLLSASLNCLNLL